LAAKLPTLFAFLDILVLYEEKQQSSGGSKMSDNKSRVEISAEELDQMCLAGSGVSVIPSGALRLFDEVAEIVKTGRAEDGIIGSIHAVGNLVRAKDIFDSHFLGRPVIPGMVLMDQFFQLAGLYAVSYGVKGDGFALEFGAGKFLIPVTPETKHLVFRVDIVRFHIGKFRTKVRGIGKVFVDGKRAAEPLEVEIFIKHPMK
jgi:3-hydroxymyristoyl/3-hydroxydecanoyl-(acyl carrier protein) dehydratase